MAGTSLESTHHITKSKSGDTCVSDGTGSRRVRRSDISKEPMRGNFASK